MNCPLKKSEYIGSTDYHVESYWTDTSCEKESCAWWDKGRKLCIMFVIAVELYNTAFCLKEQLETQG